MLDTGALVALLHADDADHDRCLRDFETFRGVLVTTEAILTESAFLLSRVKAGPAACLDFFIRRGAVLIPQTIESLERCRVLMAKYADVPMDFADATLVALAEEARVDEVFTLDRRGFSVYRIGGRKPFQLRPPG